jgi:hypothetical protein
MNEPTLYAALLTKPITPTRLEKAEARADSPAVWAAVLARLKAEGHLKD